MDLYNICIPTFINPHLFWIIKNETKERTQLLDHIERSCKDVYFDEIQENFEVGDLVIIKSNSKCYRAEIQEIYEGGDPLEISYSCWLIDFAKMKVTNKVHQIPDDLKAVPALTHQASLNNIIYFSKSCQMGVTTVTKKIPSITPCAFSTALSIECIENATNLHFHVYYEENNILFGDIIIKKNSETVSLTKYLVSHQVIGEDPEAFKKIKNNIDIYKRTHMVSIETTSSQQKGFSGTREKRDIKFDITEICKDFEEIDAYREKPIMSGRRKKLTSSASSDSSETQQQLVEGARLAKLIRIRNRYTSDSEQDNSMNVEEKKENVQNSPNIEALSAKQRAREYLKKKRNETGNTDSELSEFSTEEVSPNKQNDSLEKSPKEITCFGDFFVRDESQKLPPNVVFGPNARAISEANKPKKQQRKYKPPVPKPIKPRETEKIEESPSEDSTIISSDQKEREENETTSTESDDFVPKFDDNIKQHIVGCKCANCYIWYMDDDWDKIEFEQPKREEKKEDIKRPALMLYKPDEEVLKKNISVVEYKEMSRIQKMAVPKVIAHGEMIPGAIHKVKNAPFHDIIHSTLSRLEYKDSKVIQVYAWPALLRRQHVFMIGDPKTGKTMSYLPVLCTYMLEKDDRYRPLLKMGGGPFTIILCNSSKKCEDVHDLMRVLFKNSRVKLSLITYLNERINTSNIDILVTMPTILAPLLLSRSINFKRLCHFVLEDGDSLLKNHSNLINKFLNLAQEMLQHRSCDKDVQMIVCAEHWSSNLESLAKKLRRTPLVLISNFIEAAMYGKVSFVMKMMDSTRKEIELKNVLGSCFKFEKSILLCKNEEVDEISTMLMYKGIEYLSVKDDMSLEDMICVEEMWNLASPGGYSVLVCPDSIFHSVLNITSADLLIHFALPESWTQFVKRFSCFLENCQSPFDPNARKIKCRSIVFIDETCEKMMLRFLNLMQLCGQELPQNVQSYLEGINLKLESTKIAQGVEICDTLKIFGKCNEVRCSDRHTVDVKLDRFDYLPQSGYIEFKILDIEDVTTFKVELIRHVDFKNKTTDIVNKSDEINENLTKIKKERLKIPCIGHLYLYHEDEIYCRCKVVSVNKNNVTISLIDKGNNQIVTPIQNLYKLPNEYRHMYPQTNIATIYLANLIPTNKDETFSTKAYRLLEEKMQQINYKELIFRGHILLNLGHCFWLKNVEEQREMFDKDLPTTGFLLTKEIVSRKFAVSGENQLKSLYKICTDAGMEVTNYEAPKKKIVEKPQVKPQWAFLDVNEISEVIFSAAVSPEEFTIRLYKFDKQLTNLQDELSKVIHRPFFPQIDKVKVGDCYIAKDTEGDLHCRVLVQKIEGDECVCYYVDYGDSAVLKIKDLKFLSDKYISVLPFQAILCRLKGIKPIYDTWSLQDSDILYEYAFEPDSDIYRSLFAKACEKEENNLIPTQKKYSVLLKDGFGEKKVLINHMMINCGFALENDEPIKDFVIPESKINPEYDENIETIDLTAKEEPELEETVLENGFQVFEFGNLEINIGDVQQFFLDLMNMDKSKQSEMVNNDNKKSTKSVENKAPELPQIKAAPPVDYFTPVVYWSQTESHIKFKIDLADPGDYIVSVVKNRMFNFSCTKSSKTYKLKLMLFETVDKTIQHTAIGPLIRVTLKKMKSTVEWPRLLYSSEKCHYVKYDATTISVEEEKERRILTFDVSDDSESDGEIDCMYTVCSDLDSDFDYDIPNDND